MTTTRSVVAGDLEIAIEEAGVPEGTPVVLSHGFPYDARAFDGVVAALAGRNVRVVVPYLRGYGATRFRNERTMRSGQQAALAADLLALLDALRIERAVVAGYDWGGRASCIVAALHPERVLGLVTGGGYNVHDIPNAGVPASPADERNHWYQYYLHGDRGRRGLEERRDEFCRYLWKTWSPQWEFADETFARTARSFQNRDFVDVVVHSYRQRYALAPGDPQYDGVERELARQPRIDVRTISFQGEADGISLGAPDAGKHFGPSFEERRLAHVGHDVPQEAPEAFARAIVELCDAS